ncbi:two-component system, response regulator, stage 0 sporulation protein F/two-component system, OmpR family, response regulator MprA/two-component system, NtrC family, response regulator AtoC [Lentibacillus persicus]|uniref:Two-component system, response regulator, stage 0 sporulation protein F/two-component system, OmpR family, response regulator MprA/two-component system, NtrC family, response regulator AtoC n=1 Tax=Lentibacillus persicus TaxID=640948 RepID=A0A1I1XPN2_9BACI|nr:response regulator [Lentibacillus persicus]SFE09201.1 two-component system, response regulator, stage 0 sporulation protein F/two-component system, OmpR family, response regulator MprA/two-component system, NtrC family, response regulator AtoC [Lentibacillus persicus]
MPKDILVVDDQPGIRMLLQDILENAGFRVTLAETGKEGMEKIYEASYDLLILDYKLPIMDGPEMLRRLEKEKISLPVIVMTGMAEQVRDETLQFSLVEEVFAKPFNVQDISGFVGKVI